MNIRLFDGPLSTSQALLARVERKIQRALREMSDRIVEVQVWIRDQGAHGPRGKRCRIVAQVAHRGPIVVDSVEDDFYRAVDAAAAKLHRAAERRARE
jgi:ribosome-associated translation inhibitor RaiA